MKTHCVYLEPTQKRRLGLIAEVSDGRPKVAGLIRQAIDEYIAKRRENPVIDQHIRRAESESKPTLVRIQDRKSKG